jgi:hypothetical protein
MFNNLKLGVIALIVLSGCAVGVKHDYMLDSLNLEVSTDNSIVVATLDHRNYVLDSRKNESFVGLSRGGFGNPFDVGTLSGNPLAADISYSIATSLGKDNIDARVVKINPSQSVEEALARLNSEGAQRSLLLVLREWKADTYVNVGFNYDFDISISDQQGNLLLQKQYQAKENLGAAPVLEPGGGELVDARFRSLMKELFQDPKVRQEL